MSRLYELQRDQIKRLEAQRDNVRRDAIEILNLLEARAGTCRLPVRMRRHARQPPDIHRVWQLCGGPIMKHGKRIQHKTRVLRYTDKPPVGKPLSALRWTPGAADTCGPDAPATQAHRRHTEPHVPAGAVGPQPPNHTAQAASAPRPACGPGKPGTAQPGYSPGHHLDQGGLDVSGDLAVSHVGGGCPAELDHPVDHVGEGGGGAGVVGVAHRSIKHHPVTDVNNKSRQILGGSMNAEQADTFANAARLLAGGLVGLEVGDDGAKLTGAQ